MEIIFYTPFDTVKQEKLKTEIYKSVEICPIMVSDFDELENELKPRVSGHVLIVFFIVAAEELEFLESHTWLLFNKRFIFILINGNDEMFSKGLSLYPRYIAYMQDDFKDVLSVVRRIVKRDKSSGRSPPPLKADMPDNPQNKNINP